MKQVDGNNSSGLREPSTQEGHTPYSTSAGPPVLDYWRPRPGQSRVKFCAALSFAVVALLLGVAWLFGAAAIIYGAWRFQNRHDFNAEFFDGFRCLACALILISAGYWYGRVGIQGLRSP